MQTNSEKREALQKWIEQKKREFSRKFESAGSVSFNDVEEWIEELEALDVNGESFADGFHAGTEMCVEIIKERLLQKKQNATDEARSKTKDEQKILFEFR